MSKKGFGYGILSNLLILNIYKSKDIYISPYFNFYPNDSFFHLLLGWGQMAPTQTSQLKSKHVTF